MPTVHEVPTLRLWLAAQPTARLVEVLACVGDELGSRQETDARNYITRAVACLDVERSLWMFPTAGGSPPSPS